MGKNSVRACLGGGRFPRTPFAVPNKGSTARVHSVARTMSASSHTSSRPRVSTFRAWHQPWARNDCRPLGLARLCFIAEHRVPVRSLRLIPCTSGITGGWEPRGVPLAHMLPNVAPDASAAKRPTCALSYAARVGLRSNDSDPRHAQGESARVRPLLRPAARDQGRVLTSAHCPHCETRRFFSRGDIDRRTLQRAPPPYAADAREAPPKNGQR